MMTNNTPTLTQTEEKRAPWNEESYISIEVTVSQTLSTIATIDIPENFNINDTEALKSMVEDQIYLPSSAISKICNGWDVDDFCVMI